MGCGGSSDLVENEEAKGEAEISRVRQFIASCRDRSRSRPKNVTSSAAVIRPRHPRLVPPTMPTMPTRPMDIVNRAASPDIDSTEEDFWVGLVNQPKYDQWSEDSLENSLPVPPPEDSLPVPPTGTAPPTAREEDDTVRLRPDRHVRERQGSNRGREINIRYSIFVSLINIQRHK